MEEVSVMKIRIRFSKKGPVKFIGHLDILRYFQKAFRRAEFDLIYSQGYHPHPVQSFASPLGVGLESEGEYMDIEVGSMDSPSQMLKRLNAQMTEGIVTTGFSVLKDDAKNSMSILAAADYQVRFRVGYMPCSREELSEMIRAFLALDEIPVQKKTKKKELTIDIRPMIRSLSMQDDGSILMQVSAGSAANLKPELLLEDMFAREGIALDPYALLITRLEMYAADQDGSLIPLADYQAVSTYSLSSAGGEDSLS